MSSPQIENEITSEIQKDILRRMAERDAIPRRGLIENPTPENFNSEQGEDKFYFNFLGSGPRLEIYGNTDKKYQVKFFNRETGLLLKEDNDVSVGEWVQAEQEYFVPWVIQVESTDAEGNPDIKSYTIDLEGKNVFIAFESSALGDTIAWMPIVEEFRKKHKCNVIVSSFHNEMFKGIYNRMLFVERGVPLHGMQFSFKLGWFGSGHASNRNPYDCHTRNLQQIAMDILGLKWEELGEIRPQLKKVTTPRIIKQKYVVITTCSTAQFKYWNFPEGWQQTVNYLNRKGYQVVNVGKQPNILHNVINKTGALPMEDLCNIIQNAEFFIGLPSGLAWLNWALGKKSVMITGISEHFCEFQEDMYRVENKAEGLCRGCFNNPKYIFDKGDWLYCPVNKSTPKHFECTKTVTPDMVKKSIALVEKHIKEKTTTILDKDGNLTIKKK
jgi:autotransporter strand-loop-strand O-heptosyltransferase